MEKAIKRAVEGGWDSCTCGAGINGLNTPHLKHCAISETTGWSKEVFLDPLFWQALGLTEGWLNGIGGIKPDWYAYWHRFIDHLAEGKPVDDYFNSLLK